MPLKVICLGVNGFEIGSELERSGSEDCLNLDSWDLRIFRIIYSFEYNPKNP